MKAHLRHESMNPYLVELQTQVMPSARKRHQMVTSNEHAQEAVTVKIVEKPASSHSTKAESKGFKEVLFKANQVWQKVFKRGPSYEDVEPRGSWSDEQGYVAIAINSNKKAVAAALITMNIFTLPERRETESGDDEYVHIPCPKYAYISAVASLYEGKGNMSKLMQEIERYAKQKQCLVMSLNIYRPDFRGETLEDVDPEEYRQCKSLSVKKRMKRVKRLISIYRAKGFKYQIDITEEDRMHSYGIQADLRYGDYDCMLDFHLCAYIGDGAEPPEDFKLKEYETLEELIETNPRESEYDSDRDSYEPEFEQDDPNYIFRHYPLGGLPEAPDGWDEIADSTYKYTGLVKEVDKDHCRKALESETDLVSLLSVLPAYWNTNPFLDNVHDIKIRNEQEYIVAHDFLGNCYFAVFVDKDIELYFIHDRTLGLSLANDDFDAPWEEVLHKHQNP